MIPNDGAMGQIHPTTVFQIRKKPFLLLLNISILLIRIL